VGNDGPSHRVGTIGGRMFLEKELP
jgi:hypothetical protein